MLHHEGNIIMNKSGKVAVDWACQEREADWGMLKLVESVEVPGRRPVEQQKTQRPEQQDCRDAGS